MRRGAPVMRRVIDDRLLELADWEHDLPLHPGQLLATRALRCPDHALWLTTRPIRIDASLIDDLLSALWRAFARTPHPGWRPFMRDQGAHILLSYLDASPAPDAPHTPIVAADWAALEQAFHRLEASLFNRHLPADALAPLGHRRLARIIDQAPGPLLMIQPHLGAGERSPWLRARRCHPDHLDPDALDALLDAGLAPHDQGALIVEARDDLGYRRNITADDLRALTAACLTLCARAPFLTTTGPEAFTPHRRHAA
ncbi:hypothetical protein DL240_07190 [Lujinxingia litoralis]|uniref:Uncharacterized protein n=2 Tax=Lujinxingia litoralis TaxID=2211119 RepID=A0A328C7K4_9DELT|nr:hypothetical protein DL240_07190 [Lujinxingia litoralis]